MRLHTKVVQACKFLMIVYTVFKNLMRLHTKGRAGL